jgi:hypothetical protein
MCSVLCIHGASVCKIIRRTGKQDVLKRECTKPMVKTRSIDDVPMLGITLELIKWTIFIAPNCWRSNGAEKVKKDVAITKRKVEEAEC